MGASISLDSKYRLILGVEVECISAGKPENVRGGNTHTNKQRDLKYDDRNSDGESGSDTGSASESASGSESDSEDDNKPYSVKITPEIAGHIRNYLRKNQFLDEFDLITEIELEKYDHAPGSALVFNSDSIVFITNKQTIESMGEWEYIEPETPSNAVVASKHKKHHRRGHEDNNDDDDDFIEPSRRKGRQYKTKDDSLPVNEICNILTSKFEEYNKSREFVIYEGKNSFLVLLITSVDIQEV